MSEIVKGSFSQSEYAFKEWCDSNWRRYVDSDFQDDRMNAALRIACDVDCQWDLYVENSSEGSVPGKIREQDIALPRDYYEAWLSQVSEAMKKGPGLFEADDECAILYRPTGPDELELVRQSGFKAWPPRLPEQPIFYPVTNEAYAAQIAKEWNIKDSKVGFVTRFRVKSAFMDQFRVEKVGGRNHLEWWIPAERLDELNANIVGQIEVIDEFK